MAKDSTQVSLIQDRRPNHRTISLVKTSSMKSKIVSTKYALLSLMLWGTPQGEEKHKFSVI